MPTRAAMDQLKNDLVVMGEMCENALSSAIMALIDRDEDMARGTIRYDGEIDEMELTVDARCVQLLEGGGLKDKPLRFVAAAMKINNDLERIGDHGVEVCEHVLFLVQERTVLTQVVDFSSLVEQVGQMMRESVRALVEEDVALAWKMLDEYPVVRDEVGLIFSEILEVMEESPRAIERCCHILAVSKALERVAALTANVAEEVIYLVEGRTVRHHIEEHHPVGPPVLAGAREPAREVEEREADLVRRHSRRLEKKRETRGRPAAKKR